MFHMFFLNLVNGKRSNECRHFEGSEQWAGGEGVCVYVP
jgi:hypothetical protein